MDFKNFKLLMCISTKIKGNFSEISTVNERWEHKNQRFFILFLLENIIKKVEKIKIINEHIHINDKIKAFLISWKFSWKRGNKKV